MIPRGGMGARKRVTKDTDDRLRNVTPIDGAKDARILALEIHSSNNRLIEDRIGVRDTVAFYRINLVDVLGQHHKLLFTIWRCTRGWKS